MKSKEYKNYLKSDHWKKIKNKYKNSKRPQNCDICGTDKNLRLHHKTYERKWKEKLTDLIPLCNNCHKTVHAYHYKNFIENNISLREAGTEVKKYYNKNNELPKLKYHKERKIYKKKIKKYREQQNLKRFGRKTFITNQGTKIKIKDWFYKKNKEQIMQINVLSEIKITNYTDKAIQFNKKYWLPKSALEFY